MTLTESKIRYAFLQIILSCKNDWIRLRLFACVLIVCLGIILKRPATGD